MAERQSLTSSRKDSIRGLKNIKKSAEKYLKNNLQILYFLMRKGFSPVLKT